MQIKRSSGLLRQSAVSSWKKKHLRLMRKKGRRERKLLLINIQHYSTAE